MLDENVNVEASEAFHQPTMSGTVFGDQGPMSTRSVPFSSSHIRPVEKAAVVLPVGGVSRAVVA